MLIAAVIAAVGILVGMFDWRKGLLVCLVVGFVQDPLRKITPGQPVGFVVLAGAIFVGCSLGFLLDQGGTGMRAFFRWYPKLRAPMAAFVGIVLWASLLTVVKTGSLILAGIGLLSYASPFVALFLGQRFCTTARRVGQWQKVYLAGALTAGATILMAFVGIQSPLFQGMGVELVFGAGGEVDMVTGIMRSSEIAAWHAATAACLVVIWIVAHRRLRAVVVGSAVTLALVLAVILTGRRKTLGEMLVFLAIFAFLLLRSRGSATRLVRIAAALGIAGGALLLLRSDNRLDTRWNPYLERSASVISDAPQRLQEMTIDTFRWVIARNGFFGSGAGTGAQGAQYFGGGSHLVGGSAEGGLGRVLAELGVPGLLIILWLTGAVAAELWRVAKILPRVAPQHSVRFFGLFALLPANAAVFLTAHTIFGDPFVLIVMGFIVSSALSFPQIVLGERRQAEIRRQARERAFELREVGSPA